MSSRILSAILILLWGGAAIAESRETAITFRSELVTTVLDGPAMDDAFGARVEIDGDLLLVSAPGDDDAGRNAGSIVAYARRGDDWVVSSKLLPSDLTAGAFGRPGSFGGTVATTGDSIFVGSWGPLYVFDRRDVGQSTVVHEAIALRSGTIADYRTNVLAASEGAVVVHGVNAVDGHRLLILEPGPRGWPAGDPDRLHLAPTRPTDAYRFDSAALSGTMLVVVGVDLSSGTSVRRSFLDVYERMGARWADGLSGPTRIELPEGFEGRGVFGLYLQATPRTLYVGAPSFERADGERGVVLAYDRPAAGSAGGWPSPARLIPSTRGGAGFGRFFAVDDEDDGRVLVRGPCESYPPDEYRSAVSFGVLVFERPVGGWSGTVVEARRLELEPAVPPGPEICADEALDVSGNAAVVGLPSLRQVGGVLEWRLQSGNDPHRAIAMPRLERSAPDGLTFAERGDVASDGNTLVLTAPLADTITGRVVAEESGVAYVYTRAGPKRPWRFRARLVPTPHGPYRGRWISGRAVIDGGMIVLAGYREAYVFRRPRTGWNGLVGEVATIAPPSDFEDQDDRLVVGINRDAVLLASTSDDRAYVYSRARMRWSAGPITEPDGVLLAPSADDAPNLEAGIRSVDGFRRFVAIGGGDRVHLFADVGRTRGTMVRRPDATLRPVAWRSGSGFGARVSIGARGAAVADQNGGAFFVPRPRGGWRGEIEATSKLVVPAYRLPSGQTPSVSVRGNRVAVGVPGEDGRGAIGIFDRPMSGWRWDVRTDRWFSGTDLPDNRWSPSHAEHLGRSLAWSGRDLVAMGWQRAVVLSPGRYVPSESSEPVSD